MRKSFISFIILFVFINLHVNLFSQEKEFGKIYVEITNIQNDNGDVKVTLHNQPDAFPMDHERSVGRIITGISGTTATAVFDSIPYDEYAIGVLHDENSNFIMDASWIGIPKEGSGASNDAPAKMGPPKYEDAKFNLNKAELRLKIKMVYF